MSEYGVFPFGEPVKPVVQEDRSAKRVFILGVYASAVHARWVDQNDGTKVMALAVASEPYIFWRGEGAADIIERIDIPQELGKLVPASERLNGPSGRSLDNDYLLPLGLRREDVWLSDIYPFSRMNDGQKVAIEREYLPEVDEYDLPVPTVVPAPKGGPGEDRREELWREFVESQAEIMVLLGDRPIEWFLSDLIDYYQRLSDFGNSPDTYGRLHEVKVRGKVFSLLPVVHPRQASRLGASSAEWSELHRNWRDEVAGDLF